VYDWITGDGIAGATVVFGEYSDTTGASGAYSITVPASVSSVQGVFAAFKGLNYRFRVCGSIAVDPTTNPVFNIGLYPSDDTTGYINRNLSGKVYDKTPAEIGDGSEITFGILNENGGGSWSHANYLAGSGYSTSTKSFGSNCFLTVEVADEFGSDLFRFYKTGQNLSADLNNYDHTQPSTGFTTVNFNGSSPGSSFQGYLVVPNYGYIMYVYGELSLSSQATLELYNPGNYPICWSMYGFVPDTPGPGDTTWWFTSVTLPFSATIDLPAPYTHAAPSETVDGATANWDGSTLSFDPAAGANAYGVVLEDDTGYRGVIIMNSSSITFPVELVTTVLDPGAGWDMQVGPVWIPQANADQVLDYTLRLYRGEGGPLMGDSQGAVVTTQDVTKADLIP
jgi:hypothetical protein